MQSPQSSIWRSPLVSKFGAITPRRIGLVVLFSSLMIGMGERAIAEPIPDRGPGDLSTQVIPQNAGFLIEDGTRRGSNLFHSFESFDIDPSDGDVRFTPANGVENIIGRVVGGDGSDINGLLGVNGEANLFLLDPRGIVFGENAQLDLRGSFIASTADEISFGDRGRFSAVDNGTPAANLRITPDALVFNQLANRPPINERRITVEAGDRTIINNAINNGAFNDFDPNDAGGLVVNTGRSILLAGGPVTIDGGILRVANGRGHIEISALGNEGELPIKFNVQGNRFQIDRQDFSEDDTIIGEDIDVINGSVLDVTGQNNGDITLSGNSINVNGLSSICAGIGPGLACNFFQSSQDLTDVLATLEAFGTDDARAGNIFVSADDAVVVSGGSQITNSIYDNSTAQSAEDSRDAFQDLLQGFANIGKVDLEEELFGSVIIEASSIIVDGALDRTDIGTRISSSTRGTGNAGLVFLAASEAINIKGEPLSNLFETRTEAQVFSTVGENAEGNAGGIGISTPLLRLSNSATILASTFGEGRPGNIDIFVDNPSTSAQNDGIVMLSGTSAIASNIEPGGSGGTFLGQDAIQSVSGENGGSLRDPSDGAISIRAGTIKLLEASQLQTLVRGADSVTEAGQGDAGNIIVLANRVELEGSRTQFNPEAGEDVIFRSAFISSVGENATGDGGTIVILVEDILLRNGGEISAETSGISGLSINENGDEAISLFPSGGGNIVLLANNIGLNDQSRISVSANGTNNAGTIVLVTTGLQVLQNGSLISANTDSGDGGNIFTFGTALFTSNNSRITATAGLEERTIGGDGGNVALGLRPVLESPFDIDTDAFGGRGGSITRSAGFPPLPNTALKTTNLRINVEAGVWQI